MNIEKLDRSTAILRSWEAPVSRGGDAVELIASARYEMPECEALVLPKAALSEDFFRLSTGLAGEVLQKFVNYQMKAAIVGDFSAYTSKPLQDFIRESNRGRTVFFLPTEKEALEKLAAVL